MPKGRGLVGGIANLDATMANIRHGDYEDTVLRRHPFHECVTRTDCFNMYDDAIRYMFDRIPNKYHEALMGRFARKLIKRMRFFDN